MTVAQYIAKLPQPQRKIATTLRKIIKSAAPDIDEALKWRMPCYNHNGLVCLIMPCNDRVNLQLFKGAQLSDPNRLLEGAGKGMRHLKIRVTKDIRAAQIKRWIKQAVSLNAQ